MDRSWTCAALIAGALLAFPAAAPAADCTKVAYAIRPVDNFVRALHPGDVGCLRAGTYGTRGESTEMHRDGRPSARITLKGYPGDPKPRIVGAFGVYADDVTVSGLLFEGPTGPVAPRTPDDPKREQVQVWLEGRNIELTDSEIRDNRYHAGIYVHHARNVRILRNYVHDNGDRSEPSQANLDHGIYFDSWSGLIANNVIERNYAHGVQLYPSPREVAVDQNTIVGNGRAGVIVGAAEGRPRPVDNRIANNIIATNGQGGVISDGPLRSGNAVARNVLWNNGDRGPTDGLRFIDNIGGNPEFAGAFVGVSDYHLHGTSPAVGEAVPPYLQPDDYDGLSRPQGPASDIGAFEYRGALSCRAGDGGLGDALGVGWSFRCL